MVVVSDATPGGLRAAQRISDLIKELDIKTKKSLLVINCSEQDAAKDNIKETGLLYIGKIPQDPEISKISLNGGSLMALKDEAVALSALRKLGDKIWRN
jgi:CO dehydrogenase nickel-insertion accessory protein CooC1